MNKRQRIHSVLALMAFLCISFCQKVSAQVQTLRYNTSMIANSKGYIEYLPQGYSASGTATYPLLIFIHGIGELGDGSTLNLPKVMRNGPPLLINKGTFPVSFTVNNQTFKFIVLSPQFVKWPTGADINGVISYALSHYKVDASRIYLTGFSMGGGAVWATASDVALYNKRIAAIVPMAGAYSATTARANVIADANVPVWAVHNDQDPTVPVAYTNNFVAYIKARNPSLPVKKTIYSSTSHNCWSRTYVPTYREDGLNIYEWMLQFKKGTIPSSAPATNQPPVANAGADKTITLPTSSVTLSGSGSDADGSISKYSWTKTAGPSGAVINSPSSASTSVTGLVQGSYTFRLTVTDNGGATAYNDVNVTVNAAVVTSPTPTPSTSTQDVNVNLYGGSYAYNNSEWNNWNVASALKSAALKYSDGTASTIVAAISDSRGVNDNYSTYGGSMAPDEVLRFDSYSSSDRTLTLSGLSASKTYNLELYASRRSSSGNTIFTINGVVKSIATYNNLTNKAAFASVAPNAQGQIIVKITGSSSYNYLNGFKIAQSGTTTTSDGTSSSTSPTTSTGGRSAKINLYGGSYAYNNSEWNNWNVASALKSAALKYSDGTASTIVAAISDSRGVNDNYSTYGGSMAPDEVLRFDSYSSSDRTLTLSGLSASKTYNLELYASRRSSSGNTIFTINGVVKSIATYNNLTNKAAFASVAPNAQGQIIVKITGSSSYNYLNGLIITEESGTLTATLPSTSISTSTQDVNVNLYGGSYAYNNSEWNNWNVASALKSAALKYSDGTASTIVAAISDSRGVNDNYSTYGGSMAPDEVLRFDSYSSSDRTLTLSGLSASKTYNLELYASRRSSSGNTIFTINGVVKSIATYNNLTNKAAFASVAPNAQGQIIVKITGSSSYNYLNGFKLSEVGGLLTTSTLKVATTTTETTTPALDVFPNPVTDKFALQVNNDYTGAMDVQIFDMSGALRKEFQLTKSQAGVSQTYLSIGDLTAGNYVIKVQMANWNESKQIVKL